MMGVILYFLICVGGDVGDCDDGTVVAQSCPAAEAWIRGWLVHGQTLHVTGCMPYGRVP